LPALIGGASFLLGGAGFGAVTSVFGIGVGTAGFAVLRIGASLLLSTAANALIAGGQKQEAQKAELARPNALPAYRSVYGLTLATGTPAPLRVRGDKLVGCWILNSRPSAMTQLTVYVDKRAVTYTGDPFDFTLSGGALATNDLFDGHLQFWIGRGDQTTPPVKITTDFPFASGADEELFKTTDGWQNCTVLWAILKAGDPDQRQERWPAQPPLIEVEAEYSLVYDPREETHDPDDPGTWVYSDNHALCCLDAVRTNPVKVYPLNSSRIEQYIAAADLADLPIPLKAGGTEPQYTVHGTILWNGSELHEQIAPLFAAGAARPVRVGGQLGIVPGAWEPPSYTLTDELGGDVEVVGTQAGDLPTQLRTTYVSRARLYETAQLDPYDIPGALAADGGLARVKDLDVSFAGSATQAMRVQKIEGGLARQQRRISLTAPPSAINLVGGSVLTSDLPGAWARLDGTYRVESLKPAQSLLGEDKGVALRCPLVAVQHSADIYAWDPEVDEQDIESPVFNEGADGVSRDLTPPTFVSVAETTPAGTITMTFETPDDDAMTRMEFWLSATTDPLAGTAIHGFSASPNLTYTRTQAVGPAYSGFVFARVTGGFGSNSAFTAPQAITTAP
jgi:hypothetical protein